MPTPAPYNLTLTSQTPTLVYTPTRDGLLTTGWNISYSEQPPLRDPYYGAGSSSHRTTFVGASVEVEFTGTAAFIQGKAPGDAYKVVVDGNKRDDVKTQADGLLVKLTDLDYGDHKVTLTVIKPELVSIDGAILTVGVGKSGIPPKSQIVNAVLTDGEIKPNPFFQFFRPPGASSQFKWKVDAPRYTYVNDTPMLLPSGMSTAGGLGSQYSASTFSIENTSMFLLRGSMCPNASTDQFSVIIKPPSKVGPPKSRILSLNSSFLDDNEVLFWESGLDSSVKYDVQVRVETAGKDSFFSFRTLELIDAGGVAAKGALQGNSASSLHVSSSLHLFTSIFVLFMCIFGRKLLW